MSCYIQGRKLKRPKTQSTSVIRGQWSRIYEEGRNAWCQVHLRGSGEQLCASWDITSVIKQGQCLGSDKTSRSRDRIFMTEAEGKDKTGLQPEGGMGWRF
jgi:hypothetical protein